MKTKQILFKHDLLTVFFVTACGGTSASLGLLATTSPCVLPLYPGFLAYLSGGQEGLQGKPGRYFLDIPRICDLIYENENLSPLS